MIKMIPVVSRIANKKLYAVYNFRQVKDFIVVILDDVHVNNRQQFHISFNEGSWETDILEVCDDYEVIKQIHRIMETIKEHQKVNDNNPIPGSISVSDDEVAVLLNESSL